MYFLTTCASCAAPLDSKGTKQCSRCKTRYCSATCQREHWARGGHDSLCKKIKKGGGAEEYHADTIYARARAAAVKACAEDTKGHVCHICKEAVHCETKEGLVSGYCACRGSEGFAHVTCLALRAKTLVKGALIKSTTLQRSKGLTMLSGECRRLWYTCPSCKKPCEGVDRTVQIALGRANWSMFHAVVANTRNFAHICFVRESMRSLALALLRNKRHEEALAVLRSLRDSISDDHRPLDVRENALATEGSIRDIEKSAYCLGRLDRTDEELSARQTAYELREHHFGRTEATYEAARSFAWRLLELRHVRDTLALLSGICPAAKEDLGVDHTLTIDMHHCFYRARWLYHFYGDEGYRDHLREAVHDLMGLSDAVVEWEQWGHYLPIRDTLRLALTHQLDWSLEDLDLSPSQAEHYMYASDDDSETKPPSASTTSSEDDA